MKGGLILLPQCCGWKKLEIFLKIYFIIASCLLFISTATRFPGARGCFKLDRAQRWISGLKAQNEAINKGWYLP